MTIQFLREMTNVVRFPIEERCKPSIFLLWEIAPNLMEVSYIAEAFGIEADVGLGPQREADQAMAEYIEENIDSDPGPRRRKELDKLLKSVVEPAIDACKRADRAIEASIEANALLARAQAEGGYCLQPLWDRATTASNEAAGLFVEAHLATQNARGAYRAIDMAQRGEPWEPYDSEKSTEEFLQSLKDNPPRKRSA